MDYGHTTPQGFGPQEIQDQAFFTAGVGNADPSTNPEDGASNLNTNENPNWNDPWAYTPEHNNAAIGNKIIANPENFTPSVPGAQPEYGKIMTTAPNMPSAPSAATGAKIYNTSAIRTSGDHLDKNAIAEIRKIEDKLSQDGDLSSFYSEARELTSVNLKNSYNRNLGEAAVAATSTPGHEGKAA